MLSWGEEILRCHVETEEVPRDEPGFRPCSSARTCPMGVRGVPAPGSRRRRICTTSARPRACVGGRAHRLLHRTDSTTSGGRPCRPRRAARAVLPVSRRRCRSYLLARELTRPAPVAWLRGPPPAREPRSAWRGAAPRRRTPGRPCPHARSPRPGPGPARAPIDAAPPPGARAQRSGATFPSQALPLRAER
jgi:hypothetical protein